MKNSIRYLIVSTFSLLGIVSIISGIYMPQIGKVETNKIAKVNVRVKKVTKCTSNEIKVKDIKITVNDILSSDIKTYLQNPEDIDDYVLDILKLDVSNVNTNNTGTYKYRIIYNKKIYNGNVIVIDKPLPEVSKMTLKSPSFEINTILPQDVNNYIEEKLDPEVENATKLDLSNVDVTTAGNYLYSVTYNGKFYTSTITIYEPKSGSDITNETNINTNTNITNEQTTKTS